MGTKRKMKKAAKLSSLIISLILLFNPTVLFSTTRDDVIANAIPFTVVNWTCVVPNNTYRFITGNSYTGEAYMYGGNDSISSFLNKISQGMVPRLEAGIDCSAYASRALGISRQTTESFPGITLPIDRSDLRAGDLLNYPSHHVYLFYQNDSDPNYIWVYEAKNGAPPILVPPSGSSPNPGEPGYPGQQVVYHKIAWPSGYDALTAFPLFSDFSPSSGTVCSNSRPEIKVKIKSGTNITASSIVMKLDGAQVSPILSLSSNATTIDVSYTPTTDLTSGQHEVYVYAKNILDLEDDTLHPLPKEILCFLVPVYNSTISGTSQPRQRITYGCC
jgi:hypothetical protein